MHVNNLIPDVRNQLETNTNSELVEKGAECLGNLAKSGGNMTARNIEDTLERSIELLKQNARPNNTEVKKYAAILILRELSKKLPVITFNKLFSPSKHYLTVFQACKDQRVHVRDAAAQVICACVAHISERLKRKAGQEKNARGKEGQVTETMMIFTEVEQAFGKDDDFYYQHSALTILGELISQDGTSTEILSGRDNKGRQ
jgi:hypothetical protein